MAKLRGKFIAGSSVSAAPPPFRSIEVALRLAALPLPFWYELPPAVSTLPGAYITADIVGPTFGALSLVAPATGGVLYAPTIVMAPLPPPPLAST